MAEQTAILTRQDTGTLRSLPFAALEYPPEVSETSHKGSGPCQRRARPGGCVVKVTVFEGPPAQMAGWRHYMVVCFAEHESSSCISTLAGIERTVASLKADFYRAGTWEGSTGLPGTFPAIRPDILASLAGTKQTELSL